MVAFDRPALRIAGTYALFGTAWIVLSDAFIARLAPDPAVFSALGTWKGLAFVLATTLVLYLAASRPAASRLAAASGLPGEPAAGRGQLVLLYALLAAAILLLGLGGVAYTAARHKQQAIERLQTIADLKAGQIEGWLAQRQGDAESLRHDDTLVEDYLRWRRSGDTTAHRHLLNRFNVLRRAYHYERVLLLDEHGEAVLTAAESHHPPSPTLQETARRAMAEQRVLSTGLYRMAVTNGAHTHLEFVAPLPVTAGRPRLAVVLDTDPDRFLFPFLQAWPVPSASAETLLFRRDGEDILFLNELRHRPDSAAAFRVPLSRRDLLASQVADGRAAPGQAVEGVDYRDVPVLGAVRAIAGTPWRLIAKMDKDELYAPAKRDAAWIAVAASLCLILAAAAAGLIHKRRELRISLLLQRQQRERLQALELLGAIAEGSTDAIVAKDAGGRYLLCNRAAAHGIGRPPQEILGRDDAALFAPQQAARLMAADREVMAENRVRSFEATLGAGEAAATLLVTAGPLHDAAGAVTGVFAISRDITERKRAEEQLRKLFLAVEQSPESIVITDLEARIEYCNEAFVHASGYAREEVLGRNSRLLHSGLTPRVTYENLWSALGAGRVWHGEFINRRKNGEIYTELASISPVRQPDGRITHYLAVKEDVTERKRIEAELERHRHHLEELVAERTAALEATNKELESFSYSVSHDLRAPLRAINGFAHELLDSEQERVSPEGRDFLNRIMRNAARMGQLIDDILDFSRVTRTELRAGRVDMALLAHASLRELADDYPQAQVHIGALPAATGDETMLKRVYSNLIGNALKYSGRKDKPEVEVGARAHEGRTVYFVKDNGAGFDMQYAGRLFGVFQRMHSDAEFPGTGIGLAIVKRIVERHGGRVWAEAAPDQGATFHFTLGGS